MMLEKRLDFLPIEESIELFKQGINLTTTLDYVAYIEEVEDGYDCEIDSLLEQLDEVVGIYDKDGKIDIDDHTISLKLYTDDFERVICPAPTYIDLLKYLDC